MQFTQGDFLAIYTFNSISEPKDTSLYHGKDLQHSGMAAWLNNLWCCVQTVLSSGQEYGAFLQLSFFVDALRAVIYSN
jgi:hypothetical protein